MKYLFILFFLMISSAAFSQKEYLVKHTNDQLLIDGKGNEATWKQAVELTDFDYHWREEAAPKTSFRALWDGEYLYFLYEVEDHTIYLKNDATFDEEMHAVNSDRIEIFFKSKNIAEPYYALEMDAEARIFDSKGIFGQKVDREWDWPKDQLILKSSMNDQGYTVEGRFSLSSIQNLGLRYDDLIHAGLYRGEYIPTEDDKPTIKWISWVKADSPRPNFHLPSSFGLLRLEE